MLTKGTHCHNLDNCHNLDKGGLRFWPGEECLAHREPRYQLRADHRADRSGEASPDPGAFEPGQVPGPVNIRGKTSTAMYVSSPLPRRDPSYSWKLLTRAGKRPGKRRSEGRSEKA